jgi:manganese/iron transport system permease protein/iron/zinc/copper transport system permease protein
MLTEPWAYAFFRTGFVAAVVSGALCGLVGVFVVLRRMSYMGHGLSHAVLGGAVASYVIGVNVYLGAGLWGLVTALLIDAVARRRKIGADAAIGTITIASFAVGVALISRTRRFSRNFEAVLFGNILGVTHGDVLVLVVAFVLAVVVIVVAYRGLLFSTFDPDVAAASGVRVRRYETLLALVLAVTIISTMRVLGITLIAGILVIPAVVARLSTDRFSRLLVLATVVGAACGAIGMYVSYFADVSSGATIVLVSAVLFALAWGRDALRGRGARAALLGDVGH